MIYSSLDEFPVLKNSLLGIFQQIESESKYYTDLFDGTVIYTQSPLCPEETGGEYVIFWTSHRYSIFKLLVRTNCQQEITHAGVLEFAMDPTFVLDFEQGTATLNDYRGEIRVRTVENFLQQRRGNDEIAEDCWRMIFGTATGTGGSVIPGEPGGIIVTGPIGGGNVVTNLPYGCTFNLQVVCGCSPEHVGGSEINPVCHCHDADIVLLEIICPLAGNYEGVSVDINKTNTYWDCVDFLNNFGLLSGHDLYARRLLECGGYQEPYDLGPNNPTNIHPDFDFCSRWENYRQQCLTGEDYRRIQNTWAQLLFSRPAVFHQLVNEPDPGCTGNQLAGFLNGHRDFEPTPAQVAILRDNPDLLAAIQNLLGNRLGRPHLLTIVQALLSDNPDNIHVTPDLVNGIGLFWDEHGAAEQNALESVLAFLALKFSDDSYQFDRFHELYSLLRYNPNALMENCQDNHDLSFWNDLIAFQLPASCEERLEQLGPGWEDQPLGAGDGVTVNLDLYELTITQLPAGFNTMQDFFNFFRLNLTSPTFIDSDITSFLFLNPPYDQGRWSSPNPVTTVFTININVIGDIGDDGSVICSDYDACCWVFSTITAPQWGHPYDGAHPVSGNRQFGYRYNPDGTHTLYTKAADRADRHWLFTTLPGTLVLDQETAIYEGGHNCWSAMLERTKAYIESHQGAALPPNNNGGGRKPSWGVIRQMLQQLTPITSIPCD